jgi:hypothetical protein
MGHLSAELMKDFLFFFAGVLVSLISLIFFDFLVEVLISLILMLTSSSFPEN